MEEQTNNTTSGTMNNSAQTAHAVHGAIMTGKAIAGAAKGIAAGGPYGALAAGLWQNRKTVLKVILVAVFIMMLPILFILMLPALIFGGFDSNSSDVVMNDNSVIMTNIQTADQAIQTLLQESYDMVMDKIQQEISNLPQGTTYEIINPYEGELLYNSRLIISQYCVANSNYQEISMTNFQETINRRKEHLFSFRKEEKSEIVMNQDGTETTKTSVVFTIQYAGEDYFANTLFALNDDQKELAKEYAANLNLFLEDQ